MSPQLDTWSHGYGHFCANPECELHVTSDDPRVQGSGHWASVGGVTYDRHPIEVDGPVYCMQCRRDQVATTKGAMP